MLNDDDDDDDLSLVGVSRLAMIMGASQRYHYSSKLILLEQGPFSLSYRAVYTHHGLSELPNVCATD